MVSTISLVTFGLLFVTITTVIQSAPVELISSSKKVSFESIDPVKSPSIFTSKLNDVKKKRNIDDYDQFDEESNEDENTLHTEIKETPAKIHGNTDKPVDADNSKGLSDLKMSPNELANLARKRRNIHFNDGSKRRHKRALSTYEFYNTNPFYESLIERQQFDRPTRTFASSYWYPSSYTRNIRSPLDSSFYESPEWNIIYPNNIENDDIYEDPVLLFVNDNDDENDRYPNLLDESTIPYDNLQLQQEYNIDDLPIDEDDGYFSTHYEPIENYFK